MSKTSEKTPALIRRDDSPKGLADRRTYALTVVATPDGKCRGRTVPFQHSLSVGREADTNIQLVIEDRLMSRRHFTLELHGERVDLIDHDSTNLTFVDGVAVKNAELAVGAVIRTGHSLCVLEEVAMPLQRAEPSELVGNALVMQRLRIDIERVARTELPALILGETGTGKELVAHRLHSLSQRKGPFVPINCAAIPAQLAESVFFGHKRGAFTGAQTDSPGAWVAAQDGTLFLDEVGELPIDLQAKVLRVLDTCELTPVGGVTTVRSNARIVAATNVDLAARVSEGSFRADLYARLAVYVIRTPALRERRSDILTLFDTMLGAKPYDVGLAEKLLLHDWPMNVRELRNAAQRLLTLDHAPLLARDVKFDAISVAKDEAPTVEVLQQLLKKYTGNVAQVATELGRDRKQIYRWLKKHGIDAETFRKT